MDVKDYSQKVSDARDKYREAQETLRASYEKDTDSIKETADNKIKKLSKSYDNQKSKLEEQNLVNNQVYSEKTKNVIAENQERFKNDIKKSSDRFDQDRNVMKEQFSNKLSNLSDSYKKSTEENNRYFDQASKTMGERYQKANKNYKESFDKEVTNLDTKSKKEFENLKESENNKRVASDKENMGKLEELRSSAQEQKFREVSRLRNDNQNLRTNFARERESLHEQQEARIDEALKNKNIESAEGQKVFAELQRSIREKEQTAQERTKQNQLAESKELEKKFSDDLKNVQHLANQKIKGGNEVTTLKDENKQLVEGYEKRLAAARNDAKKDMEISEEKEKAIDSGYREKLKGLKASHIEELDKRDATAGVQYKKGLQELRDKNTEVVERYKAEVGKTKVDGDSKLAKTETKSKAELKNQRVEFGKYINDVNSKKMEEVSSIKDEFAKDKTAFIEKTRKDISDEKTTIKQAFNHQMNVKEDLYESKLAELEKQTSKIIENYEAKMNQLVRSTEKEVDVMKSTEEARRIKETQATKIAFENNEREHQMEMDNLRSKYESMIGKDRAVNELQTNRLVQRYEDMLERERSDNQKALSLKLSESQAQFERLFKASELEKETLRNQYEQRIDSMKNQALIQGNSKKA